MLIRFNQGVQLGRQVDSPFASVPSIRMKNVSREKVEAAIPEMVELLGNLFELLPKKKYALVDVHGGRYRRGKATCVDPGWHLDGKMDPSDPEEYAIWCDGPDGSRTLFHQIPLDSLLSDCHSVTQRRALFSSVLGHCLNEEFVGMEVPNQTPVKYTTFDFHKGRVVSDSAERLMVRAMVSNVIRPQPLRDFTPLR